MITTFFFVLALIVFGLLFQVFRKSTYREEGGGLRTKNLWRPVAAIILALVVAAINPVDVQRIDAGYVGIKVSNVGDDRGIGKTEYVTGWVFYNAWISRIYEFPIHQQHIDYEEADIVTRGGFRATIKPSFNY
ncbi:MAG: hypothetical protein K0Q66_1174, partial [Chitinophagaceae bacterium]|nr:hypothetical protein [Chitinophagaceae bacterium]